MLLLLFLSMAVSLDVALCQTCARSNCKKTVGNLVVQYASFTKVPDVKFASWTANETVSVTGTQEERERACAKKCMNKGPAVCKAADLSPYQEGLASDCQLFNENAYEHMSSQLPNIRSASSGYTSFHLFNSFCESVSCQNDGICRPDFSNNTGVCECSGYSGRLCEIFDPFNHKEAGYWDFEDHSVRNTAPGTSTIGNGANYRGVITTVPERKGKVMQCTDTDNSDCFAAPVASVSTTPCLSDFSAAHYCPTGFTYGFWTRLLDIGSSSAEHNLATQCFGTNYGFCIIFQQNKWLILLLELDTIYFRTDLLDLENIKRINREWVFIGFTYDPSTSKAYTFFDEKYAEMATGNHESTNHGPAPFHFEGNAPFFVDNIFYFPKYSTADEVSAIYDLTKAK